MEQAPQRQNPMGRRPLQAGDIMSREVITAAPQDTIASAARTMSEHNVSCVVVVEAGQAVGILTEKDVLKGVAGRDIDFHRLRVQERMTSPPVTIPPDTPILDAGRIMSDRNIRRLPIVQDGRLLGVVTETDTTRGLVSLNPLRYISDIMTDRVATVAADAWVDEAARTMSEQNASCVIAQHHQEAAGIVTEKDILRRVVALHKNPTQTHVVEIMSFPVVSIPPTYSILSASRKMESMHVHRLIVMEGKELLGLVTQTDILRAIQNAFEVVERERREMVAQFVELMRGVVHDAAKAQDLIDRIQGFSNSSGSLGSPHDSRDLSVDPAAMHIL
ncbi:MAG: CBS domain-containing protein [Phycisphaerae bacterium]|nr:CBS domain-containing protein [Phycisphaerae bacterium]